MRQASEGGPARIHEPPPLTLRAALLLADHHVDSTVLAGPLQPQRHGPTGFPDRVLELGNVLHGRAGHVEDDVARLYTLLGGGALDGLDHQAALCIDLPALVTG